MGSIPPELSVLLRTARYIAVLTGAGISAESGIPTFRDATSGLWSHFNPEDLATLEAFERNPELVWSWYSERRQRAASAKPNAGHLALARLEQHSEQVTIITQNVDGLHQRAGSSHVLELHGSLFRAKCLEHGHVHTTWDEERAAPPHCGLCGSLLRPDVVWFGEALPMEVYLQAQQALASCDLLLVIGTSGIVEPAASLPHTALQRGTPVVIINPEATPLLTAPRNQHWKQHQPGPLYDLRDKAGSLLPRLVSETWED
jgi:NAD-dependent deacetylase